MAGPGSLLLNRLPRPPTSGQTGRPCSQSVIACAPAWSGPGSSAAITRPNTPRLADIELAAIYDPDPARATALAERLGTRAVDRLDQLVDAADVVSRRFAGRRPRGSGAGGAQRRSLDLCGEADRHVAGGRRQDRRRRGGRAAWSRPAAFWSAPASPPWGCSIRRDAAAPGSRAPGRARSAQPRRLGGPRPDDPRSRPCPRPLAGRAAGGRRPRGGGSTTTRLDEVEAEATFADGFTGRFRASRVAPAPRADHAAGLSIRRGARRLPHPRLREHHAVLSSTATLPRRRPAATGWPPAWRGSWPPCAARPRGRWPTPSTGPAPWTWRWRSSWRPAARALQPAARARSMPAVIMPRASSASPQRAIFTHLPGSRSL